MSGSLGTRVVRRAASGVDGSALTRAATSWGTGVGAAAASSGAGDWLSIGPPGVVISAALLGTGITAGAWAPPAWRSASTEANSGISAGATRVPNSLRPSSICDSSVSPSFGRSRLYSSMSDRITRAKRLAPSSLLMSAMTGLKLIHRQKCRPPEAQPQVRSPRRPCPCTRTLCSRSLGPRDPEVGYQDLLPFRKRGTK